DLLRVPRDLPVEVRTAGRGDVPVPTRQRIDVGRELVVDEEAGVEGALEVQDDRVRPSRAGAREALREEARREGAPVGGALVHRGPDQRNVEQQVLGIDRLTV